jgi:epoxyqueuosine reductase
MVREDQVAPELPAASGRQGAGHGAGGALRRPRLLTPARLKQALAARAGELGFAELRVATPAAIPEAPAHLRRWLAEGCAGEMGWMAERAEARADPARLWSEVRSIILLGTSYAPETNPLDYLKDRTKGAISVYALRRDYHEVIKGRLKTLAGVLAAQGAGCKVFVDTAPVMEKPLAAAAGLGWQGKHTVLVSRRHGNWLWLGAIYTTAELPVDAPEADRCGSCRRCLDICPTDAFPAPYRLDARRCISYLTIETKGPIPREFRRAMGNRIYGCDDCLAEIGRASCRERVS